MFSVIISSTVSQVCDLCGKGIISGRKVARTGTRGWVKRRSKRTFKPNLRQVKVMVNGKMKRMRICAKCLKSKKVEWEEE